MKLLRKATSIFDGTINLLALLAAILIVFMMLAVTYEVVMRYFLTRPTTWVIEITELCLLFVTFLGTAWLLREEGHVRMDLVLSRLKPKTQATLNIVTSIIGAIICLTLFWYGARVSWDVFVRDYYQYSVLNIPYVVIIVVVPIGSFLLSIQFLRRAYGFLGGLRAARAEEQRLLIGL